MRTQAKKLSPRGNNSAAARIGLAEWRMFGSVLHSCGSDWSGRFVNGVGSVSVTSRPGRFSLPFSFLAVLQLLNILPQRREFLQNYIELRIRSARFVEHHTESQLCDFDLNAGQ